MTRRRPSTLWRRPAHTALVCVALTIVVACQDHDFEPPSREAQVSEADSLYSPELFDTIAWDGPQARTRVGNGVYASECRKCHGTLGRGNTAYDEERGLEVPSLVEPDWEYAESVEAVRRRTFTGHPAGMPTWGVAGITPREIDAVAHYLIEVLRPDVLGGAVGPSRDP